MENWKAIKGYEGKYLVSDQGRVMNVYGNILTPQITSADTLQIDLDRKHIRLALVVASAFIPNCDRHKYLEYKDGNKHNCSADNLFWTNGKAYTVSQSRPVVLISHDERIKVGSLYSASILIGCCESSLRTALMVTDTIRRIKGYAIAYADDVERIRVILRDSFNSALDIPFEEWKRIKGCKGYWISNKGRVKSSISADEPMIMRPSLVKTGYLYISFRVNRKNVSKRVHRLVAEAFLPNPNDYPEVNHIDGNPLNNEVSNLEWCTREYNIEDEYRRAKECSTV